MWQENTRRRLSACADRLTVTANPAELLSTAIIAESLTHTDERHMLAHPLPDRRINPRLHRRHSDAATHAQPGRSAELTDKGRANLIQLIAIGDDRLQQATGAFAVASWRDLMRLTRP